MEEMDFNKPTLERPHPITKKGRTGTQKIWRFKNGWGASVVRFELRSGFAGSYGHEAGLWEMAVIKFKGKDIESFDLHYKNPVAKGDVLGHLTEAAVVKLLKRIRRFKKRKLS